MIKEFRIEKPLRQGGADVTLAEIRKPIGGSRLGTSVAGERAKALRAKLC